ncbi:HNH endonuclease [Cypionkella sp.]|uniref:HNH endonuclease n=1 Tax=Cypionkella sp. TaxID=2811411 RepID=UPI00271AE18B|nr:HNH endonuclease [Cypionkella sp.]MDO8984352.1 HNH endonuclease [Cypionkella sp.]MDP2048025.1 HNH endonuclease [Cypionkella sp.]
MTPQNPPGFLIETEANKAAYRMGWRIPAVIQGAWLPYTSHTIPGTLYLAAVHPEGPWIAALSDPTQLPVPPSDIPGPGTVRLVIPTLAQLHTILDQIYLQALLPPTPLQTFQSLTATLPRETEAERLRVERIGQDIFRARLLQIWNHTCPLTGITEPALLRASHIIPWAACDTDAERLNPDNGLLLSALWDAAFDRGLVTFTDEGSPIFHETLSAAARAQLTHTARLPLTAAQQSRMARHRNETFALPTASPALHA